MKWKTAREAVYTLNRNGVNHFYFGVQGGFDDAGNRVPDSEAEALAQHIARLLYAHPFRSEPKQVCCDGCDREFPDSEVHVYGFCGECQDDLAEGRPIGFPACPVCGKKFRAEDGFEGDYIEDGEVFCSRACRAEYRKKDAGGPTPC